MKRSYFEESEDDVPNYTRLWELWFIVVLIMFIVAMSPIGELTPVEIVELIKNR